MENIDFWSQFGRLIIFDVFDISNISESNREDNIIYFNFYNLDSFSEAYYKINRKRMSDRVLNKINYKLEEEYQLTESKLMSWIENSINFMNSPERVRTPFNEKGIFLNSFYTGNRRNRQGKSWVDSNIENLYFRVSYDNLAGIVSSLTNRYGVLKAFPNFYLYKDSEDYNYLPKKDSDGVGSKFILKFNPNK